MTYEDLVGISRRFESPTRGLGLQKVVLNVHLKDPEGGEPRPVEYSFVPSSGSAIHATRFLVRSRSSLVSSDKIASSG